MEVWTDILDALEHYRVQSLLQAAVILLAGFVAARMLDRRLTLERLRPQHRHLIRRVLRYALVLLAAAWALSQFGLSIGVLLGAAGLVTIALGFAAQTSVSNVISGIFLMAEQPFVFGDVIKAGDVVGEVVSIDLISVRIRTFDNLLVRIPNESMLRSNVTNMTFYPIRRFDLKVGVGFGEDLARVRKVLMETAAGVPVCLDEPPPLIILLGFGESAVELQLSVWATRENFLEMRNTMHERVLEAFRKNGIDVPYPHRTLLMPAAFPPPEPPAGGRSERTPREPVRQG